MLRDCELNTLGLDVTKETKITFSTKSVWFSITMRIGVFFFFFFFLFFFFFFFAVVT